MTTATIDPTDILASERQRVSEIESACLQFKSFSGNPSTQLATLRASALSGEISMTELQSGLLKCQQNDMELAQVRSGYPSGPKVGGSKRIESSDHLAAALMVRAGYSADTEKAFGENTLEQSRPLHRASLVDMCRAALTIDCRECPESRDAMIRAALSTGSMPVALGNAANKTLTAAYMQALAAWRSFAAVKPAANFKTQTGIRPSFGGDLSQLPPGGNV